MFAARCPSEPLRRAVMPFVIAGPTFALTLMLLDVRYSVWALIALAAALYVIVLRIEARDNRRLLEATSAAASAATRALGQLDQGVVVVGSDGTVKVINDRAVELLELPARFRELERPFADVVDYLVARGEFEPLNDRRSTAKGNDLRLDVIERVRTLAPGADHDTYERKRPNGTVLAVETRRLPEGGFVRILTDTTDRHRSAEKLARMARHDALTSLPNRQAFRERLEGCLAARDIDGDFTLMFIDVDAFKLINDTHGQPVGDCLLRALALRIGQSIRSGDIAARTAGDEYAIILRGLSDPAVALARAKQIVNAIREPFIIDDRILPATVSIGLSVCPRDGIDGDTIVRCAEIALERAKAEGRDTCRLHKVGIAEGLSERSRMGCDLARAVLDDQLALHYQPLVSLGGGRIVGFEALLRWNHPERGIVSPTEFLSVAEETGLIVPIGQWVLARACADAVGWPTDCRVAVNLSAVQFRAPSFVEDVRKALDASGLDPRRLELEVTESAVLRDAERMVDQLRQLQDFGLRIAMDDFGAGYSSLAYLGQFAFDRIKIDRGFIAELGRGRSSDSIVRAIVSLARGLGAETTAVGVETHEQLEAVRAMGCDEAQGFLFSPPRPLGDVEAVLAPLHLASARRSATPVRRSPVLSAT